jgi:hypothetical protein
MSTPLNLTVVSGRVHGDDDDSVELIWTSDSECPSDIFEQQLLKDSGIESHAEDDSENEDAQSAVYIISTTTIGTMTDGVFVLNTDILAMIPPA